jgi:hypothetical protein
MGGWRQALNSSVAVMVARLVMLFSQDPFIRCKMMHKCPDPGQWQKGRKTRKKKEQSYLHVFYQQWRHQMEKLNDRESHYFG